MWTTCLAVWKLCQTRHVNNMFSPVNVFLLCSSPYYGNCFLGDFHFLPKCKTPRDAWNVGFAYPFEASNSKVCWRLIPWGPVYVSAGFCEAWRSGVEGQRQCWILQKVMEKPWLLLYLRKRWHLVSLAMPAKGAGGWTLAIASALCCS